MYMEEDGSGETVIENTSCKTPTPTPGHEQTPVSTSAGEINDDPTPGTSVDITNNEMGNSPSPEGTSTKYMVSMKYWLTIKCALPKEVLKFTEDIIDNVITYSQLQDFATHCDIPQCWVERAKEDYPHDSEIMVTKVFYEWWGRSTLTIGNKVLVIQKAFGHMGKPAVFDRLMSQCPDLTILLEYAKTGVIPALPAGNGATSSKVRPSQDDALLPSHHYIKQRKVSADEYEAIHRLSAVIQSEEDYVTICISLGVPLDLGPKQRSKYSTWMLQTEATLMKFFVENNGFLYKMAHIRTAFNACSYLMFCDETLVELGYRISVIHEYAGVHSPPQKPADKSSSDSSLSELKSKEMGKGIGKKSKDKQKESAEFLSTPEEMCDLANKLATERRASGKPIIEYEQVSDEIILSDEDIQGIISLRFEKGDVNGDTPKEILKNLDPKVMLKDVCKDK